MCVPQLASLKTPQEKMLENEFEKLWMSHQKEIKGEIKREFEEKLGLKISIFETQIAMLANFIIVLFKSLKSISIFSVGLNHFFTTAPHDISSNADLQKSPHSFRDF